MTETKKQIKQLKAALPGLKEKVVAVALLLAVSVLMVATVSYAWVTMSTAPEASAIKTTVAANGALEIALSDFDGEEPEKSGTSDSFAAEGQSTHAANTSWGNLVNLSNEYGLESLVLRPAKLDLTSDSYIYSMNYGNDGRVESILSDFTFTTWYQTDKEFDKWSFIVPPEGEFLENGVDPNPYKDGAYGVRAISTVIFENQDDANAQRINILTNLHRDAKSQYANLTTNPTYVGVIQKLVQKYLDENINAAVGALGGGDFVVNNFEMSGTEYIEPLTALMQEFYDGSITTAGNALVYAANLQMDTYYASEDVEGPKPADYTLDTLLEASGTELLDNGIKLEALGYKTSTKKYTGTNTFKSLHDTVLKDLNTMKNTFYQANGEVVDKAYWNDLEPIVNNLIHITSVKVEGKTIGEIAAMGQGALDFVGAMPTGKNGQQPASVVIQQGSLWNFEALAGEFMGMRVAVKATYIVTLYDGIALVTTSVSRDEDSTLLKDRESTEEALGSVDRGNMVARDTYGMILDLWVRTNAESSMLTLNGTPEVVAREEPVTITVAGHDAPREVYIYTYYTGGTVDNAGITMDETASVELYEVYHDPDGDAETFTEDYYYYDGNTGEMAYEYELQTVDGKEVAVVTETPVSRDSKDKNGQPALVQKTYTVYDVVGFTAANRIWQEGDTDGPMPEAGEISTTQGSGSCYIFHADSDEEYENTKNLLKNLRLVFLDEDGRELSRARLDMEQIYAENGKYTVPLYLESYSESIVDEEGNVIEVGLCRLEKNVARRISVLVYLEGEDLENDMVMSAESVLGSLNLQFDSTADLQSLGDGALALEMIELEASLKGSTELTYDGQTQYVTLNAVIGGITPNKVEATFARMYTNTQGTQGETVELKLNQSTGFYEAAMPFLYPGRYVLEALTIDGVDYKLASPLEVNVSGFNVSQAAFDTKPVLTADKSTTKSVTVRLNSAVMPESVTAQFVSVDKNNNKSFVNVVLDEENGVWTGDAVFNKSGQYTLTYLIMDGEPYELPTEMQKSFMAYLGLTADVVLERWVKDENGNDVMGELRYDFAGPETINAFVMVYDDAGNPLNSLGEITLYYVPYGSTVVENGFKGVLKWNGEEYAGSFEAKKPGRFVFGELRLGDLGDEKIKAARKAPELNVISTVPPTVGTATVTYEGSLAYYVVNIENAATANRYVVMTDGSQDYTLRLEALPGSENYYRAAFPDTDGDEFNGTTNSNGNWTIKQILFDNVYADGKFYEEGSGEQHDIDMGDEYAVVNYLLVETSSMQFGGTSLADATDGFMTSYNLYDKGLSVTVKAPIGTLTSTNYMPTSTYADRLTDAAVTIAYDASTSNTYGGYTGASNKTSSFHLKSKTVGDDVVTYTIAAGDRNADGVTLQGAGKYTVSAAVVLDNSRTIEKKSCATIEIFSKKPTVKITTVSPTSSMYVDTGSNGSGYTSGKTNTKNTAGTEATVYIKCERSGLGKWYNPYKYFYTASTVTITTDNTGYAHEVNLTFVNRSTNEVTALLHETYTNPTGKQNETADPTGKYSWGGSNTTLDGCDGVKTLYVGYSMYSGDFLGGSTGSKIAAGTITANVLELVYDGVTYTVSIPTITINNPY